MSTDIKGLIDEYAESLNLYCRNQYIPKLNDYFANYIKENFSSNIEDVFSNNFNKQNLIDATLYYITKNENVEYKSAIDDFLIALTNFFDTILFKRYPNPTLQRLIPFSSVASEVEKKLLEVGIELKKRTPNPTLSNEEYIYLLKAFRESENLKQDTVLMLMLMYGLDTNTIKKLKIRDFIEDRYLLIENKSSNIKSIKLEIPHVLIENLKKICGERTDENDLIFKTREENKIRDAFTTNRLKKITTKYCDENNMNRESYIKGFTPTGIQKYAIKNMIKGGINQSIIIDFTGQSTEIFNYCQNEVNIEKNLSRNRYVNSKIRGIKTFDDINELLSKR